MSRIGVVTGSRIEAGCLGDAPFPIVCSGASAERARRGAERLIADGADALVSFGLAGALSPELSSGTLLLPHTVAAPGGARWGVDEGWHQALLLRLQAAGTPCRGGLLAGSDRVVATISAKRQLFQSTNAIAVDVESHAVAVVAGWKRVPFLVLRAIADRADQTIPDAALAALGTDGRTRMVPLLLALARRPRDLPLLIRLARASRTGLESLRAAATALRPGLTTPIPTFPHRGGAG